ncbi:hypothetical protein FQA39_LY15815 [Lamprigera yunnana]|nr:hypothetical protein FQA39_LY15815 [Lamprigera yunnana]
MTDIDNFLNKKYILASSENLDQYLKATGINSMMQRLAQTLTPVIELTKSGDEYTFSSVTALTKTVITFKVGVEFDKVTPDGQLVKSVVTIDSCTMLEVQTDSLGRVTTIERTFSEDEVKTVREKFGVYGA